MLALAEAQHKIETKKKQWKEVMSELSLYHRYK